MTLYLLGGLAFFFPVAAYLLFLALINGRPKPTVISGPWDFVGVLCALSGFLLIGGPMILFAFHSRWRPSLDAGNLPTPGSLHWSGLWIVIWAGYFVLIVGGSIYVLWLRRAVTMVYNADGTLIESTLAEVLSRLNLGAFRVGNRIFIGERAGETSPALTPSLSGSAGLQPSDALTPAINIGGATGEPAQPGAVRIRLGLEVDPFPSMCNVAMHWSGENEQLRRDVEAEIAKLLADVESPDNPAAGWLLTVSSCLFSAIFLSLIGFILIVLKK